MSGAQIRSSAVHVWSKGPDVVVCSPINFPWFSGFLFLFLLSTILLHVMWQPFTNIVVLLDRPTLDVCSLKLGKVIKCIQTHTGNNTQGSLTQSLRLQKKKKIHSFSVTRRKSFSCLFPLACRWDWFHWIGVRMNL